MFSGYSVEVVLQNLSFYHLQIDGDSFVEPFNHEKIVLQVIVAVFGAGVSRYRTGVLFLLNEQEDPTVVGQRWFLVARQAIYGCIAGTKIEFYGGVHRHVGREEQSSRFESRGWGSEEVVKLFGLIAHPRQQLKVVALIVNLIVGHLSNIDGHRIFLSLSFDLNAPAVVEKVIEPFGVVVVGVVVHEGQCEGG